MPTHPALSTRVLTRADSAIWEQDVADVGRASWTLIRPLCTPAIIIEGFADRAPPFERGGCTH